MNTSTLPDTLWRKRSRALLKAWPGLRDGDEDALHKARVASRRLREALPILVSGAEGKVGKTRRQIRRVTRALGPVRELDVALSVVAELEQQRPTLAPALAQLRERMAADRASRRARMLERIARIDARKLNRRISELVSSAAERNAGGRRAGAAWRGVLAARIARRAERLRAAIERAGSIYLPDRLHAVRVAVKKLRYSLELAREAERTRQTRHLRTLKRAQDALGRLHDLEILTSRARSLEASLKPSAQASLGNLDALIRVLEDECRQLHAAYVARREAVLDVTELAASELSRALTVTRPRPARVLTPAGRGGSVRRTTAADRRAERSARVGTREDDGVRH